MRYGSWLRIEEVNGVLEAKGMPHPGLFSMQTFIGLMREAGLRVEKWPIVIGGGEDRWQARLLVGVCGV